MNPEACPRRDEGFTLLEVLVTIVITSIVVTTIAVTVSVALRTMPSAEERSDTAITLQGLTTWLPPDVDSAKPGQFDIDSATVSGCSGTDPNPGINLLRVSWDEMISGVVTQYVASYRFTSDGTRHGIVRVACSGIASLGMASLLEMTGDLAPISPVVTPRDTNPADGKTDSVLFTVTMINGDKAYIEGVTKNPDETLPPFDTTVTDNTLPPPAAAPANNPPVANNLSTTAVAGVPVAIALPVSDAETTALAIAVDPAPSGWSIAVTGLAMTASAPASAIGSTVTLTYSARDPEGASDTGTLSITVVAASTNRAPVPNPVEATIVAGVSTTMNLAVSDPDADPLTATVSGVPTGVTATVTGTSLTVVAAPSAVTPSSFTYTVRDSAGHDASSTVTLVITTPPPAPPCVISGMSVSPSPVGIQGKDVGELKKDVTVTVTVASGYCVGLTVQYDTGAPNGEKIRNLGNSAPYSVVLEGHPHGTELWSTGTHTLEVRDGSNTLLRTTSLVVE